MGFNSSFYAIAEDHIKECHAENVRLQNKRKEEIEQKIPAYKAIRLELGATGTRLSKLFFGGEKDVKSKLKIIENDNLVLQDKTQLLLQKYGYPTNYLDPIYTCNICKDTGIYDNKRCSCFTKELIRLASADLNSSSPLRLCSFTSFDLTFYSKEKAENGMAAFDVMKSNYEFCKQFAENFHLPYNGILMRGDTGLGKTHLSLSIAKDVLNKGYSVIYCSAPDIFKRIEGEHFGKGLDNDTLGVLQSADLLILDDLGAEFESQFYVSTLYNILNNRINASKPIILNTNLIMSELKRRYTDRIVSRFYTLERLTFMGSDIRIKNRKAF